MAIGSMATFNQSQSRTQPKTVLDALIAALRRAGEYNRDAEVAPLAILWPDGGNQWQRIVPELRLHLPILTLGPYDAQTSTGPPIWIRAELATRAETETPPIIYLPGIRKEVFRNVEDAPADVQVLLYLQYRGTMFLQPNGRDWTLPGFFQNAQRGLGIKVDGSEATRSALVASSPALLNRSLDDLRNHAGGIDADFLNMLLISDMPRQILDWIHEPAATRGGLDAAAWIAFGNQLRTKYKIDPERDGPNEAARELGSAVVGSYWIDVWNRFAESPASYPAIPAMLRGAKPGETGQRGLFPTASSSYHWPQDNEDEETALRQELVSIGGESERVARQRIIALEHTHASRRASVWARLGHAPLAFALEHLAFIAQQTINPFPAGSVVMMQAQYTSDGWRIDAAALEAVTAVTLDVDRQAIDTALDRIYTPWLWTTAERFQQAIGEQKIPASPSPITVPDGTCVLFADGLRFDLAAKLTQNLTGNGATATITGTLGSLPGVTPSAKPAQSPVIDLLVAGVKMNVNIAASGTALNQTSFKKLLAEKEWIFLETDDTGTPDGTTNAWTEFGNIDSYGHSHTQDLPRQAQQEIRSIQTRIERLLGAGWKRVVVVTDHGWLLTPRPMAKTDLPQHLTIERKGRCARLTPGATTHIQTVPWCWNPEVSIAMAPGINCFEEGRRYDHGGLSLQESIVPTITVSAAATSTTTSVQIVDISWSGLRCIAELSGWTPEMSVDIRTRFSDPESSLVVKTQNASANGIAKVLVADDAYQELSAIVVVLDGSENVIAQRPVIIGGE
jgi:hypothetical protein